MHALWPWDLVLCSTNAHHVYCRPGFGLGPGMIKLKKTNACTWKVQHSLRGDTMNTSYIFFLRETCTECGPTRQCGQWDTKQQPSQCPASPASTGNLQMSMSRPCPLRPAKSERLAVGLARGVLTNTQWFWCSLEFKGHGDREKQRILWPKQKGCRCTWECIYVYEERWVYVGREITEGFLNSLNPELSLKGALWGYWLWLDLAQTNLRWP